MNEQVLRKRAKEVHGTMKTLQTEVSDVLKLVNGGHVFKRLTCTTVADRILELLSDRTAAYASDVQLLSLEHASERLQLLLVSGSNMVKAAHELPDAELKKCSGYSTAAAVCLTTVGVCLFAPVVPVVGGAAIACSLLGGAVASATGFGITLSKAIDGGKAWTAARQACEEGKLCATRT